MKTTRLFCMILLLLTSVCFFSCKKDPDPLQLTYTEGAYNVVLAEETYKTDTGYAKFLIPTITDLSDTVMQEELNEKIKAYTFSRFQNEGLENEFGNFEYEITETAVTLKSDVLLSIISAGYYYADGAPHNTDFVYTINCDLITGHLIDGEDIISDFDSLKALFESGGFIQTSGKENLLSETNFADMFIQYRSDYEIYPYYYFTPDSFGLTVDLAYVLDGWATFDVPYNTENSLFLNRGTPAVSKLTENLNTTK